MICLVICRAIGARVAICSAISRAFATTSGRSATSVTKPQLSAVSASTINEVKIIRFARATPTVFCSRAVPPHPGRVPMPSSDSPTLASVAITRISQASASSRPPPNALPSIAAIDGCRNPASLSNSACPRRIQVDHMRVADSWLNALISAPAEKARSPALVTITARTSSESSMTARCDSSCSTMGMVNEFSLFGREM